LTRIDGFINRNDCVTKSNPHTNAGNSNRHGNKAQLEPENYTRAIVFPFLLC
jgi:hypothetical protein